MEVFREFFDCLKDVLTDDSVRQSVASLLFSKCLITAEIRDTCTVARTGSTSSEKALQLLSSIETRLQNDLSSMDIFIEVLRDKLIWQTLVDRIEQAYLITKHHRNDYDTPSDNDCGTIDVPSSKRLCVEKDSSGLDVDSLSDESQLRLYALKRHFASMIRKVVEILQILNINLSSMRIYIKEMLKPNFEVNAIADESCTLSELFYQLSSTNLWDYWNYQLLADIIMEFGNNDTEKLLSDYDREFIQFNKDMGLKPTILIINRNKSLEPATPKSLTNVEIKLNESWYSRSLMGAKSILNSVLSKAKRIFFSGGRINCVILEFQVMWTEDNDCNNEIILSDDDCQLLQQEGVLSLSVNDRLIFSKLEESNFETVDLNVIENIEQNQEDTISYQIHPETVTKLHKFVNAKIKAAIFQLEVSNLFILSVQFDQIHISDIPNISDSLQQHGSSVTLIQRTIDALVLLVITVLPLLKDLTILSFSNLPFGSQKGGVLLLKGLAKKPKLTTLQLINTKLNTDEANALIEILPNFQNLSTLNLSHNNLPTIIMINLTKCLPHSLKMLYLSSNELNSDVAYNLSIFLQTSLLSDLFLTDCNINDLFIEILSVGLHQNCILKTLSIGSNPISDIGAVILMQQLIHSKTSIQMLNLWNTPLTSNGIHKITSLITNNSNSLSCITLPLKLKNYTETHNDPRITWI